MLPFEPEPITRLASRYGAAVQDVVNANAGQDRRYVFDCQDGLRLIISREVQGDDQHIHISASMIEGTALYSSAVAGIVTPQAFLRQAANRFRLISQDSRELHFVGFSREKGIPHWYIDLA
jgi:hypothetical protein